MTAAVLLAIIVIGMMVATSNDKTHEAIDAGDIDEADRQGTRGCLLMSLAVLLFLLFVTLLGIPAGLLGGEPLFR